MKLEYFTKLPVLEVTYGDGALRANPDGTIYLRASDIVSILERTLPSGEACNEVLSNSIKRGTIYYTPLTPAEVVTEIARANDAVKADAEHEMEEMMAKMQGTRSLTDSVYGDAN